MVLTIRGRPRRLDLPALARAREFLDSRQTVVRSAELETLTGLNRYARTRHFRAVYGTSPYRYSLLRGLISRETACGVGSTLSTWPLRRASPIKRTSPACSHRPTACSTRGGQRRRHGIS